MARPANSNRRSEPSAVVRIYLAAYNLALLGIWSVAAYKTALAWHAAGFQAVFDAAHQEVGVCGCRVRACARLCAYFRACAWVCR